MSWSDLDPPKPDTLPADLAKSFVRAFSTNDGNAVLEHLRARTIERAMQPGCSDAELRHLEGQRDLCRFIINTIARGVRS